MSMFSRMKALFRAEGSHRGPFYGTDSTLGGWHQFDPLGDGWQRNMDLPDSEARHVPAVYACVMLIARSVSQCYPTHYKDVETSPTKVITSPAYKVLRRPNSYQSGPEFFLNLMSTALFEGEAFAVVTRDARSVINSIHLMPKGACAPLIDDDSKEIFYSIGDNPLGPGGQEYIAPARDVLHLKFHAPRHPLIGESPLKAASLAAGVNVALAKNQAAFFNNMNRPSGVLTTDMQLNAQQMHQLRAAFAEQSKQWASGGMPILASGLKFQPMAISSQDAQLVQAQRMSVEDICRVYGVPPPLIGDLSHATLNNTETLIAHFLSMSLGSYLETLERTLDRLFGLSASEYIELDTQALLRTNFETRINGLTKAVQGGLMTPNETRLKEGLAPVVGGDEVYLQRQMVSLETMAALAAQETAPAPVNQDPVEPPPAPVDVSVDKQADPEISKALVISLMSHKRKAS